MKYQMNKIGFSGVGRRRYRRGRSNVKDRGVLWKSSRSAHAIEIRKLISFIWYSIYRDSVCRGERLGPNFYSGSYLFWYLFRPQQKSNRHPNFDLYLGFTRKMKPLQSTPNLEDKILKNIFRDMFSIPSKIMVSILSNIIINRRFEIIQRTYQIKIEVSRKSFLIFQNRF